MTQDEIEKFVQIGVQTLKEQREFEERFQRQMRGEKTQEEIEKEEERRKRIREMLEREKQKAEERKATMPPRPPRPPTPEKHWTEKIQSQMFANEKPLYEYFRDKSILGRKFDSKTAPARYGVTVEQIKEAMADPRVKKWLEARK